MHRWLMTMDQRPFYLRYTPRGEFEGEVLLLALQGRRHRGYICILNCSQRCSIEETVSRRFLDLEVHDLPIPVHHEKDLRLQTCSGLIGEFVFLSYRFCNSCVIKLRSSSNSSTSVRRTEDTALRSTLGSPFRSPRRSSASHFFTPLQVLRRGRRWWRLRLARS